MSGLLSELKRRKVIRVAGAYAVVAWLLIEVSDTVFPRLGLPEWTVTFVIALVLLGFPVALFLAWAFELTPDGVERTGDVAAAGSVTALPGRKLDLVVIALLLVTVGWFAWDRVSAGAGARGGSGAQVEASIAVLPFIDMSSTGDQEYLADGLAEEILNLLAGVQDLKVSGRTSSFAFKGKDTSIPEIGRSLGVAHVLEGSVRKSGDRVRVTAQLVKADDGFHLWSETFDRQLEDIFAIQDDIAGAIAAALQLTLGGQSGGAGSIEAYDLYLQARRLIYTRDVANLHQARRLIDRALELDPDYPPALAASGELWQLLSDSPSSYGEVPVVVARAAAREQLERALSLDPNLADAHAAMGLLFSGLGDYAGAQGHLARALAINPSLTNANHWHVVNLMRSGRGRDAVAAGKRFAGLDPLFVNNLTNLVISHAMVGDFVDSEQLAHRIQRSYPELGRSAGALALSLYLQGRLAAARAALERSLELEPGGVLTHWLAEQIHYSLGDCDGALRYSTGWTEAACLIARRQADDGLARVRARLEASPENTAATWGLLHGLVLSGRHEELLDWVVRRGGGPAGLEAIISHDLAPGSSSLPLAVAQHATGRETELAATLRHWGETLTLLEENGNATGLFRFNQASHDALSGRREAALARLTDAIDAGYRDPLLASAPTFEQWDDDPNFLAQVARMRALINIERADLGWEPLP